MSDLPARLARLETTITNRDRCPACGNYPTRIVGLDGETGAMLSETMPETGCPACGRPPRHTVHIIGVDAAETFAPAGKAG